MEVSALEDFGLLAGAIGTFLMVIPILVKRLDTRKLNKHVTVGGLILLGLGFLSQYAALHPK